MSFRLPGGKPKPKPAAFDEATVMLPAPLTVSRRQAARLAAQRAATGRSAAAPSARPLPLIGKLPVARQYGVLGVVLLILAALAATTVIADRRQAADGAVYLATAANMRMLTQRFAKAAEGVTAGNAALLPQLQGARGEFADSLKLLMQGGESAGRRVPASSDAVQPVLDELSRDWTRTERNIGVLLAQQKSLAGVGSAMATLQSARAALRDAVREVQALKLRPKPGAAQAGLLAQLAEQVSAMLEREATARRNEGVPIAKAAAGAPIPASGQPAASEAQNALNQDAAAVRASLEQLRAGADPEAAPRLDAFEAAFNAFQQAATAEAGGAPALAAARTATRQITDDSETLFNETQRVVAAYEIELTGRTGNFIFLAALTLFAGAAIWLMVRVSLAEERRRAREADEQRAQTERRNIANQDAILRLMNEMSVLAAGDLRARATVGEDITGAIADAVNFTVEELSKLVSHINGASSQLFTAATAAQRSAEQLLTAADYQSQEIRASSATVLGMAGAMTRISGSASQSAEVAGQSLAAAGKGREAVAAAIVGMDGIRVQIQETAKRMKRLGESSQEIGEIVELISDITEQTNVLALNASIQAASAGEAGRGFSVVAEEVQRLAERSGAATRRIGAIVKTIQADTQETVAAMEKSTQGVVEGARLSDAAGRTLGEIGTVSSRLAGLVGEIRTITEEQGRVAQTVAGNMQNVLNITEQTSAGTKRTAQSIQQLSQLAQSLKASVANFKI
jgi:twitching motility protein PilJ